MTPSSVPNVATQPGWAQLWLSRSVPLESSSDSVLPPAGTWKILLRASQRSSFVERRNNVVRSVRVETMVLWWKKSVPFRKVSGEPLSPP